MRKSILALMTLTLLAGCGGGSPSESDMKTAMVNMFKGNPVTAAMFTGFQKFEKLECKPVANAKDTYDCRFKATATIAGINTEKEDHAIFAYGDKGWFVQQ